MKEKKSPKRPFLQTDMSASTAQAFASFMASSWVTLSNFKRSGLSNMLQRHVGSSETISFNGKQHAAVGVEAGGFKNC